MEASLTAKNTKGLTKTNLTPSVDDYGHYLHEPSIFSAGLALTGLSTPPRVIRETDHVINKMQQLNLTIIPKWDCTANPPCPTNFKRKIAVETTFSVFFDQSKAYGPLKRKNPLWDETPIRMNCPDTLRSKLSEYSIGVGHQTYKVNQSRSIRYGQYEESPNPLPTPSTRKKTGLYIW